MEFLPYHLLVWVFKTVLCYLVSLFVWGFALVGVCLGVLFVLL
jgi:hypothetical protein